MTRVRRVWLRLWVVVVCAALGGAVGYGLQTRAMKTYTATATVYVTGASGVSGSLVSDEQVASYARIATSPPLLQRIAASVGGGYTPSRLAGQISASQTFGTTLIAITATDRSALHAAAIANATAGVLRATVHSLDSGTRLVSVQSASDPPEASSPRRALYVGVGLAVGLLIGLLIAAAVPRRQ